MAHITVPDEPTVTTFNVAAPQTVFSVPWTCFDKTDIQVKVGAVVLEQTDFTFTGNPGTEGGFDGATITLNTAASATTVVIWRSIIVQRTEDFGPGPVSSRDRNTALDRLTAMIQDGLREASSAIRGPIGSVLARLPAGDGFVQMFGGQPRLVEGEGVADARNVILSPSTPNQNSMDLFALLTPRFDVRRWGAKVDMRTVFTGAMTNGANILTAAGAAFTAADIGKVVVVQGAVPNGPPLNLSRRPLVTTITAVTNATTAVLADAATRTCTASEVNIGTADGAAFQRAIDDLGLVGGEIGVHGHALIDRKLNYTGENCRIVGPVAVAFSADETAWDRPGDNDFAQIMATQPARLLYAGPEFGTLLEHDILNQDGFYLRASGNGASNIVLDGAGRASYIVRSYSAPALTYAGCGIVRATLAQTRQGVTTNPDARLVSLNVAARDSQFNNCFFYNRGSNIFGSVSVILAGDKSGDWGNLNYCYFTGCRFLIENDGSLPNIIVEQIDNLFMTACNWNARMVIHSADSGQYSTFSGYLPGTNLLAAGAPSTRVIVLRSGFFRLSIVGAGSVAVSNGTSTVVAGTTTATSVTPADFEVSAPDPSAGGTLTLTVTGAVSSWTLTHRPFASQARTISIGSGCAGLIELKAARGRNGGARGPGFHAQNVNINHYVVENINSLPIIEAPLDAGDWGPDCTVVTDSAVPQAPGAFGFGFVPAGVALELAANQSIPNGVWTVAQWPAPALNNVGLFDIGSPGQITSQPGLKYARMFGRWSWASNGVGRRYMAFAKNGTRLPPFDIRDGVAGGDSTPQAITRKFRLAPGETYAVHVLQTSGGALNGEAINGGCAFDVECY
jgi:hypothetical protein